MANPLVITVALAGSKLYLDYNKAETERAKQKKLQVETKILDQKLKEIEKEERYAQECDVLYNQILLEDFLNQ